jgi:hypothetical protein
MSARVNSKEKMKNNMKKNKVKETDVKRKESKMSPESYDEMAVSANRSLENLEHRSWRENVAGISSERSTPNIEKTIILVLTAVKASNLVIYFSSYL